MSLRSHPYHYNPIQLGLSTSSKTQSDSKSTLFMASSDEGNMKKRRRRKIQQEPEPQQQQQLTGALINTVGPLKQQGEIEEDEQMDGNNKDQILAELKAVASFKPTTKEERKISTLMNNNINNNNNNNNVPTQSPPPPPPPQPSSSSSSSSMVEIELPDIKNVLQKKELKKMMMEEEKDNDKKTSRPKISRKDKKAYLRLLEEEPFADANDLFFEEEEYDVINALLGERAQPFLGIPPGPLQVGHFIGALVLVLMAFVQYPGFPLTNLPTPLRDALQGGLLLTYSINVVLAVFSSFKAAERGQPKLLWVFKTLSVGGLAYDQLTQLPTLEESRKQDDESKKKTNQQSKAKKR